MRMPFFGDASATRQLRQNRQQSLLDRGSVNLSHSRETVAPPEERAMRAGLSGIPDQADGSLLDLLLTEVVPRLNRLACGPSKGSPVAASGLVAGRPVATMQPESRAVRSSPLLIQALELAEYCERADSASAAALVARLRREGVPVEALLLQLITPAAQHLGQGWVDDRISFTDVTIGAGLLQQLFSSLMDDFHAEGLGSHDESEAPSGFFCTLPGASHRLGVQMVRAFFTRAGWQTRLGKGDETTLIAQMVGAQPDLIGLSLGSETDLRNAASFILRARHACRSFQPAIMVGGAAVPFFPSLVERLDADIVSGDAVDALSRATALVKERSVGAR